MGASNDWHLGVQLRRTPDLPELLVGNVVTEIVQRALLTKVPGALQNGSYLLIARGLKF